ncbi:MAG: L,D-transpeptidase [Akkermansiaceae bacterium]|nr:L,D-transpeptidase [Akkermansiaceae bacterium]MCF7732954.1 L,D-transpeptidase [Akkermansiaceae bacterium]
MQIIRQSAYLLAAAVALLLANCAPKVPVPLTDASGNPINPFPPGTYEHFTAEPTYPKTSSVWKNEEVLSRTIPENSHIHILIGKQRGLLMNGDEVAMDYPICSGINGRETPLGEYTILEKVVDKSSNRYGRIYDAAGDCVNSDADATKDEIPEGGRFQGASMRYWMRLTNDGIGHHIGPVKRYRASHGCIRGPSSAIPTVHEKVKIGTLVTVE